MARQLPPLNGLRAFEAAARHLSFTKAADELFVTQAAISHQVKGLEDSIGHALFNRVNRGLKLTPEGQILYPAVSDGLDLMASALRYLHETDNAGTLTISTMDSFAAGWLVPKLAGFRQQYREIDVRLAMGDRLVDFAHDEVDLAIRYGPGHYPGCETCHLMDEVIFPVISPDLLASGPPINTPDDILKYTLLHDIMPEDWNKWFSQAGVSNPGIAGSLSIEHSYLVIQAAVAGQGIALGRSVLVADQIASGHLVRLLDISLPASYAYYMVGPPTIWNRPKIKIFRDWIMEQIAESK
ncbi:MAG: transcriptional regulator GcvA [Rhodospirillales bacterium]|nr:transcriptional regulator GcvA [Rhodospirillales bacterium]